MTPTARMHSYEAAKDVERCCIHCKKWKLDCDCKPSDQFPVIPETQATLERFDNAYVKSASQVTMHNDGPHDAMNPPSEEVIHPTMKPLDQIMQETWEKHMGSPVEQVQAERGNAYGDPEYNLGGIAKAITGYLENKWQTKLLSPITEHDVAMFNVLQKVSRMARTPGHADSLLDAHSYLDLAAKAVERG